MGERDGDPTDLQQENARLQSEVALLRDALENMRHGLCMFDTDGRIAYCNSRYPEVVGLPADRVKPGLHARDLVAMAKEAGFYPPERTIDELELLFWNNLTVADPQRKFERNGRTLVVHPGHAPSGRLIATFEDVTAEVEAQTALHDSELRLRAILEAMPDCVKIFDPDGRLVYINPQGLDQLQAPDLESAAAASAGAIPREYLDQCRDVHSRVIAGEKVVWRFEIVGLRGRRSHVEAHAVPFRLPDGTPAHLCISRDITERMNADEALRLSEQRLRLVQEASGRGFPRIGQVLRTVRLAGAAGQTPRFRHLDVARASRRPRAGD